MMKNLLFILSMLLTFVSSIEAEEWKQLDWKLESPERKNVPAVFLGKEPDDINRKELKDYNETEIKSYEDNKVFNEKIDRERVQAKPAEDTLRVIGEWMQGMKYPQATMWSRDPLSGDHYPNWEKNEFPPGILKFDDLPKKSLAEYRSDGTIILSKKQFLSIQSSDKTIKVLSEEDNVTLAHELFHGIQLSALKFEKYKASTKFSWISEGLAEAVGYAWQQHEYGHNNVDKYDIYYDSPLFEGSYARGHFFYYLGVDLKGKKKTSPMKFAPDFLRSYINSPKGVMWLDNYLKTKKKSLKSLAEYYPKFIAKWAADKEYFNTEGMQFPSLEINVPFFTQVLKEDIEVKSIASTYDELNVKFDQSGNWSKKKDKERIYAVIVDVYKAERMDDTSLIVLNGFSKRIHKGAQKEKRDVSLFYAESGELKYPLVTNVTNVSQIASESKKQKFTLRLTASPISFDLPSCMKPGSKTTFKPNGDISLEEFSKLMTRKKGSVKLKASAGKINKKTLEFTAPNSPKKVKITLTIPTISGGRKKIDLGTINVQQETCGIKMTFSGSNNVSMTWDDKKQITEIPLANGGFMLIHKYWDVDVYFVYSPERGWHASVTGGSELVIIKSIMILANGLGLPSTTNYRETSMPNIIPSEFSWENLKRKSKTLNFKVVNVSCPNKPSEKKCKRAVFNGGLTLKYDESERVSELSAGGNAINFEYGNYPVHDLPPLDIVSFPKITNELNTNLRSHAKELFNDDMKDLQKDVDEWRKQQQTR